MKYQPNKNYQSNDVIMTPVNLAKKLVEHFKPSGKGLEPCCGTGNILQFLVDADWCEITKNKNFFDYNEKVDYIFTNPPWSQIRSFLEHSMTLANDIYLLFTINHLWTKARLRDIKEYNFGIVEICLFDTPNTFPQTGFQLGMVHIKRNYDGELIKLTHLDYK